MALNFCNRNKQKFSFLISPVPFRLFLFEILRIDQVLNCRLSEYTVHFKTYNIFPQPHGDYTAPMNRPRPRGGLDGPRVERRAPNSPTDLPSRWPMRSETQSQPPLPPPVDLENLRIRGRRCLWSSYHSGLLRSQLRHCKMHRSCGRRMGVWRRPEQPGPHSSYPSTYPSFLHHSKYPINPII